jgi:hypothetical protein
VPLKSPASTSTAPPAPAAAEIASAAAAASIAERSSDASQSPSPDETASPIEIIQLTVKIPRGSASASLAVLSGETVSDCLQQLLHTAEACTFTCASLAAASAPATPLALSLPLASLLPPPPPPPTSDAEQPRRNLTLTLIPAPFDERSARENVARLHELLTSAVVTPSSSLHAALVANSSPHISVDQASPPTFTSITEIHSWKFGSALTPSSCITSIRQSSDNPPPPFRRLRGELFYLDVTMPDGAVVSVTASTGGFSVRQSDDTLAAAQQDAVLQKALHPTLASCLSAANARFKTNFARLISDRFKRDPCEMLPSNTFTHTSWLVPQGVKRSAYIDHSLLSDPMVTQRDWNEDLFALLAAPSDDIMSRDRTIMKTQVEFMEAAKALAVAAVDGGLAPVNPLDDVQSHIYIANNLFASRCADNFDAATRFPRPHPFPAASLSC